MRQVNINLAHKLYLIGFPPSKEVSIDNIVNWFKKTYNLYIETVFFDKPNKYCYRYYEMRDNKKTWTIGCRTINGYNSQEDALEAGIKRAIKNDNGK